MINTIELFQQPSFADAWHNVTAPGGYEWWHFDAEDAEHDRQIVVAMSYGDPFSTDYLDRYSRYAKHPTRHAPPIPSEYISVQLSVYRDGKPETEFFSRVPAEQFSSRFDALEVQMGANRLAVENDALMLWLGDEQLTARLSFKPLFTHAASERELLTRSHHWIIANALCDVEGEIRFDGQAIPFRGRGYHDHQYGLSPIIRAARRWLRGRALLEDRCIAFQFLEPCDKHGSSAAYLVECDADGMRAIDISPEQVKFDSMFFFDGASFQDLLRLDNVRALGPKSHYEMRLAGDATWKGARGRALCRVTCVKSIA